jgi:hypothetical protein
MPQDKLKLKPSEELIGISTSLRASTGNKNPFGEVRMAPLQRGYAWTKTNIKAFFSDVFSDTQVQYDTDPSRPGKPGKFYGVLILIEKPSATNNANHESDCEIVDGQQRITTIFLLASILKDHLEAIKAKFDIEIDALQDPAVQERLRTLASSEFNAALTLLQTFLFLSDGKTARLRTWSHLHHLVDDAVYKARCHVDKQGVIKDRDQRRGPTKAFADAIVQLRELVEVKIENSKTDFIQAHPHSIPEEHFLGQLQFIKRFSNVLLENSYTVKLWSDSPQDGNAAFLSLNSKGKALATKDIVKALILSSAPDKSTETTWASIEKNVDDVDQFLRIFWMLYEGKKLTLEGLAISIGEYLAAENKYAGITNTKHFLDSALKASKIYKGLVQKASHKEITQDDFSQTRLQQLAETAVNYRVLLMKAFTLIDKSKQDQVDLFNNAIRLCSIMSFTFVGKFQYPQAVEDMYFEMAKNSTDFKALSSELAKLNTNVYESCKDLQLKSIKISTALGILFHLEEATRIHTPQASLKWKTRNESVEHIAPQTSTTEWAKVVGLASKYDDMTSEAGNLTILNRKANAGIKQKPWIDAKAPSNKKKSKQAAFAQSTDFVHTLDLSAVATWTDASITKRTRWIHYAIMEISKSSGGYKPHFDKFTVWTANNP